ncbi:MAG: dihydrolipoyl dehydrogenase [Anaerolineales bacterium]|nr:dihydrolipoyl dehydrogenase [Anaerolineales bacterium]
MVMGEQTLEIDLAVIGGGPGGYSAAFRAADLGLDVALINAEERLGGVCLRRGCIPTKALLDAAHIIEDGMKAREWGIMFSDFGIDLEKLRQHKQGVVDQLVSGVESLAKMRDVQLIEGRAVFESSNQVRIQGTSDFAHVKFEHAILASGSKPMSLPGVEFKDQGRIMSSAGALELKDIPERLLVIGGGYIGLEMGTTYAALGSKVTMVEMLDGILPGVDRTLVRYLKRRVKKNFEALHLKTTVASLEEQDEKVVVTLEGKVKEKVQEFDRVLVAVGRKPNSEDIGLENTDVKLDQKGFVQVDEQRRTQDPRIFAIGDVVGDPMLAHKAMFEGKVAADVIAGEPAAFDVMAIPAVVYTDPQIAYCGWMEDEARENGYDVKVARFPWTASGRATTMDAREGITKLVFDVESKRLLGMGVTGRGAEDLIAEGVFAIEMGAVAEDLALTIHPHPTLSETVAEAAEAFLGLATHIFSKRS